MAATPPLTTGSWTVDIVVQGYPGKTVCHGGLGWSTVALLRGHGRVALVDTGGFNMRPILPERLAEHGLAPADVTDVLLTHCHYDHAVNYPMFGNARIVIGATEIDWAVGVEPGFTPVPELYAEDLRRRTDLVRVEDGAEALPGITAHLAPGHTPGCLVFRVAGPERDILFTGDAAKNRAELISRSTDMTYDAAVSRASIERIWAMWRERAGTLVVAGHDLPMRLDGDAVVYIGEREAAVRAWFDDDLERTTLFRLTA